MGDEAIRYFEEAMEAMEAQELLAAVRFPSMAAALTAGNVGVTLQALFTGSCFKMIRIYFHSRPSSLWERLGMAWITFVLFICLAIGVLQQTMGIRFQQRFTAWQYQDFFFFEIQVLLNSLIYAPVLLFFLRRTYLVWDRRRPVLYAGYTVVGASFVMRMIACGATLRRPYGGFRPISNETFKQGVPEFVGHLATYSKFALASEVMQTFATGSICVLLSYGIFRHRNGARAFDSAVSKVVFVTSESMLPMFILNVLGLVLHAGLFGSASVLILRPCASLTPAVFAWCLLSALTSQDRIRDILQAEPVRHLQTLEVPITRGPDDDAAYHPRERDQEKAIIRLDSADENGAPRRDRRRRRFGSGRDKTVSDAEVHLSSAITAPLSPGGGTSTGLSLGAQIVPVMLHDDREVLPIPTTPREQLPGPLWRDGAIVRPPISFGTYRSESNQYGRPRSAPPVPGEGPDRIVHRYAEAGSMAEDEKEEVKVEDLDGGMDIFEMLYHGPPATQRR